MADHRILGISLGTRLIGMALLHNNELQDWQIKSFKPSWSKQKLHTICSAIELYIEDYGVTHLALKVSVGGIHSPAIVDLMYHIEKLTKEKQVAYSKHTLVQVMQANELKGSKQQLMDAILKKYPDLQTEYFREQKIKMDYYTKVFEAVAVADLVAKMLL
jgi:hypothetical protein